MSNLSQTGDNGGITEYHLKKVNKNSVYFFGVDPEIDPTEGIDKEKFAQKPHILKILPHYVLNEKVYEDMPCIWLYRKDTLTQFMSHVARLRTKLNHITDIKDRPVIEDGALTATVIEYERFQLKQIEFWQLYEKHGKEELLISYEDFLEQPNLIIKKINNKYENLYQSEKRNLTQTVSLGILYRNKFKNFNEIKGWFNE